MTREEGIMNCTKYPAHHLTEKEKISLCVFNVLSMTLGLFGNIMVVTMLNVHHKSRGMPSSTIILRSLAVSDILVITIVQPLYVYSFFYTLNNNIAQVVKASRWALVLASLLHLLVVSVDRFLAICRPHFYHQKLKHTSTWCFTALFIVWFITIALGTVLTLASKSTARLIHGVVGLLCFLVMITLILIHIRLFFVATRHRKKIEKENLIIGSLKPNPTEDSYNLHEEENEQKRHHFMRLYLTFFHELRAFKTTSIVCGAFLFSWLPLLIMGFIYMTTRDMNNKETMLRIFPYVNTLAFLNSAQNPFIYSVKIHTFQESLRIKPGRICKILGNFGQNSGKSGSEVGLKN